jgi:hypothetical protein
MDKYTKWANNNRSYYNNNYNNRNNNNWNNNKSHFINIPIDDTVFIQAYENFCEEIKCANLKDFYPQLLQKPGKIHMTVCVLDLGEDEEKIKKVHNVLEGLQDRFREITNKTLDFNFEKFETMGNVQSTRVIYAKMNENENFKKIEEIIHLIIEGLVNEKILMKHSLEDSHVKFENGRYKIKLHMTLFNVLFLNKILKKRREIEVKNINAKDIIDYLSNKSLPSSKIEQINFSKMRENPQTEKYDLLYSYKLN